VTGKATVRIVYAVKPGRCVPYVGSTPVSQYPASWLSHSTAVCSLRRRRQHVNF